MTGQLGGALRYRNGLQSTICCRRSICNWVYNDGGGGGEGGRTGSAVSVIAAGRGSGGGGGGEVIRATARDGNGADRGRLLGHLHIAPRLASLLVG